MPLVNFEMKNAVCGKCNQRYSHGFLCSSKECVNFRNDQKKLKQVYYEVSEGLKFSLLAHLLKHEESGLVMVFCNTRRNTDFVASNLKSAGIDATAIHGGLTQSRRTNIMKHFHSQEGYVLVCTDVAARGLDIKGVSHIYNYDISNDSKDQLVVT